MANKVDYSNLLSESWQNVYDLVDNRSNVADPLTSNTGQKRKFVYSREPGMKKLDYKGFPYIVIYPSSLDFGDITTCNGQKKDVNFTIQIDVRSNDSGYGNNDGKGLQHNDAISDDVMTLFNSSTARKTLRTNGLFFSTPTVSGVNIIEDESTKIYTRTFILTFRALKKVFA